MAGAELKWPIFTVAVIYHDGERSVYVIDQDKGATFTTSDERTAEISAAPDRLDVIPLYAVRRIVLMEGDHGGVGSSRLDG